MNQKGVTLMELLVSMAVVGIMTGVACLGSGDLMSGIRLNGAARQIYSDLQLARLQAIREGTDCALEFAGNGYAVKKAGPDATLGTGDDVQVKSVDLAGDYAGIAITTCPTRNIFYPDGRAGFNGGSGSSVALSNGVRTRTLKVRSGTGNIRIE